MSQRLIDLIDRVVYPDFWKARKEAARNGRCDPGRKGAAQ